MRHKNVILLALTLFYTGLAELQAQTVQDIEGNVYRTVTIGVQVWMAENLKTTKLNDNTSLPLVTDKAAWGALATPGYTWYDNDESVNKVPYGALYNWHAVKTNNLCPAGWHVPSNSEWTILTSYLTSNGFGYRGTGITKSMANKSGWTESASEGTPGNDQASNNSSGFTAIPGGYRNYSGAFFNLGSHSYWWSSTETSATHAFIRIIFNGDGSVTKFGNDKRAGISVRCIRD